MFVAPICLTIKNDIVEEVKNLVMAFQMSPCCCFYEGSLRRLSRRFSLIFHSEGHASDDSNKHIKTPMKYWLFSCLFGFLGPFLHRAVQRRQRGGGVHVGVSLSGGEARSGPRLTGATPDGRHAAAWRSELHLYALLQTRAQKSLDVENFMWVTLP